MGTVKPSWNDGVNEWLRQLNPDSISSSRVALYASHWVKDVEFEGVIAAWASVFALKITYAQLVVSSDMKGQYLHVCICICSLKLDENILSTGKPSDSGYLLGRKRCRVFKKPIGV